MNALSLIQFLFPVEVVRRAYYYNAVDKGDYYNSHLFPTNDQVWEDLKQVNGTVLLPGKFNQLPGIYFTMSLNEVMHLYGKPRFINYGKEVVFYKRVLGTVKVLLQFHFSGNKLNGITVEVRSDVNRKQAEEFVSSFLGKDFSYSRTGKEVVFEDESGIKVLLIPGVTPRFLITLK